MAQWSRQSITEFDKSCFILLVSFYFTMIFFISQ
uniref:Uncharacterized protein n=1 Tax=Arundo donax TaxID=35708 RepID=A0A0A8XXH2_ARUDO